MGYFLAIVTAAVTIAGNITAKIWAEKNQTTMLVATLVFYVASSVAFPLALRYGKLSVLNAFTTAIIFTFTSLAGLWLFKERISALESIGMLLVFVGILLLSIEAAQR